jgi:single-strand DNA-binding protein
MNQLNSVLVDGRLVRSPNLAYTTNGKAACRFVIATNRFYKQEDDYKQETSFLEVSTWGRQAEVCHDYLTKGRGVRVYGRLKQDKWADKEGQIHSKVYIVSDRVEFKPDFRKKEEQEQELDLDIKQDETADEKVEQKEDEKEAVIV